MYHHNVGSPASGAGQVNGQYHRPPAALATAEAAPISSSGSGLEPIWEVPSEKTRALRLLGEQE